MRCALARWCRPPFSSGRGRGVSFDIFAGAGYGVLLSGGTITNAGTISSASGQAVKISGSGSRLIVDPGAVFPDGTRAADALAALGVDDDIQAAAPLREE